jgi:Peptidase A4 family
MRRKLLSAALGAAATMIFVPAAIAATTSTNWAGYAVHKQGVRFRSVSATWTQPKATCSRGTRTFSSYWVGLGGYSNNSQALEQIGTELDCKASGKMHSTAWYELVPAPSVTLHMRVHPGDVMKARVVVVGHRVVLSLDDVTRGHHFKRAFDVSRVDISSAEWIVEAPSECVGPSACESLPLADFGTASFSAASVETRLGHRGTIVDPDWHRTKISLVPGGRQFGSNEQDGFAVGGAVPSALTPDGSAFTVSYDTVFVPGPQGLARRREVAETTLTASMVPR